MSAGTICLLVQISLTADGQDDVWLVVRLEAERALEADRKILH